MTCFQIRSFAPTDATPGTWAALHAFRRVVAAELWPDTPILTDVEYEHEMRRPDALWLRHRWLVFDGPDIVGSATAWFRNPTSHDASSHARFMSCNAAVIAEARGLGAGTMLLGKVHALMHALDKTVLTVGAHTDAGHAFLRRMGAAEKHVSLQSRLLFREVEWDRLRDWEQGALALGLSWERYSPRVPRDILTTLLPAMTTLIADMPLDDLEHPPIIFEIEDYDRWYENLDRVGGAHHIIVLRTPTGDIAGLSEAVWDQRSPRFVYQQLTGVARGWRGRGLARALKAAMLRQVHEAHPEAVEMRTSNAESNAPILSINRRVGFTLHQRFVDYQVTRDELDAKLRGAEARAREDAVLAG